MRVLVRGSDKVSHQAVVDPAFIGDADGPGPDLALIEVLDQAPDLPTMRLAKVVRDSPTGDPVERCHAIGYPNFMERQAADGGRYRETADAIGYVPVLSGLVGGLLSVQVSSAPEPLPSASETLGDSQWSGMSGGPVVADGLLLGVVTEHVPRAGSSAIMMTPLTAIQRDPAHPRWGPGVADPGAWWSRLGVADAAELKPLPAPTGRSEPAYWATVREIRKRTGVLISRQGELAEIASFATGGEEYRWLVGEPWAGKTSLLAEAAMTLAANVDVVCYFLSRREADADSSRFLTTVVPQLAKLLDEDPPVVDLQQFRSLWHRAADRADNEGRHLLLMVDGLDEDLRPPGLPSVAAQLPAVCGGRSHVLVEQPSTSRTTWRYPGWASATRSKTGCGSAVCRSQELEVLARQEIDDLRRRDDDGLAADVLGLLAAAAGPLRVEDLAVLIDATLNPLRLRGESVVWSPPVQAGASSLRPRSEATGTSSLMSLCSSSHRLILNWVTRASAAVSLNGRKNGGPEGGQRPTVGSTAHRTTCWIPIHLPQPSTFSNWPRWSATSAGSKRQSNQLALSGSWLHCARLTLRTLETRLSPRF